MNSLIYLASPYSHKDPEVRKKRFEIVCREAAILIKAGNFIFAPIAHTHPIALHGELQTGWEFWEKYDRLMLAACGSLTVLMMDGWAMSKGVAAEIQIAGELGMPINYRLPETQ